MTDKEIIEKLATEFMGWKITDDVQVIRAPASGTPETDGVRMRGAGLSE